MACEVCEHCSGRIEADERSVCKGYSYHRGCKKCYYCSETNLEDAAIFKGVIFCANCSNRIFHAANSDVPMKDKNKRYKRLYELTSNPENHVIMIADTGVLRHDNSMEMCKEITKSNPIPVHRRSDIKYRRMKKGSKQTLELKKCIADTCMSSVFAHKMSNDKNLPITTVNQKLALSRLPPKYTKFRKSKSNNVSDMRIAELGTSTEIANMALRKKSEEEAIVIKSMAPLKRTASSILSVFKINTTGDEDEDESGPEETYTTLSKSEKKHWMDRRIRSMVKLPYKNFKRKILRRSSIISALMSVEDEPENLIKKIKMLFQREITQHQRRGLERLYSTINRQSSPQKLGWLHLMHNIEGKIRCRHVATSHSYRCMRAHVMRIAGPTKSELALYRAKIFKLIVNTPQILGKNKRENLSPSSPRVVHRKT